MIRKVAHWVYCLWAGICPKHSTLNMFGAPCESCRQERNRRRFARQIQEMNRKREIAERLRG